MATAAHHPRGAESIGEGGGVLHRVHRLARAERARRRGQAAARLDRARDAGALEQRRVG